MEDDPEPRSFRWILLLKHKTQEIIMDRLSQLRRRDAEFGLFLVGWRGRPEGSLNPAGRTGGIKIDY